MIVVIQCAATKRPDAGSLVTETGEKVLFVGDPALAPANVRETFVRPDDIAGGGVSWRERLLHYNQSGTNPLGLLAAHELYSHPIYRELFERFGVENTFILSAGWGLIRADFLTPDYDITFSSAARRSSPHKFRKKTDAYQDFCQLPVASDAPMYFFGGKDYVPLFCSLTASFRGRRTVFYSSSETPVAPGCVLEHFETRRRTNWHYECASRFIS